MSEMLRADARQSQLQPVHEVLGRIYQWTLEERQQRILDRLARENQEQLAEAVHALVRAEERKRGVDVIRDAHLSEVLRELRTVRQMLADLKRTVLGDS